MSLRTTPLTDSLYDYYLSTSLREPNVLKRLREETSRLPEREMQIAPEQGQFMAMLIRLLNARKTIDVGVFTGYSALVVALALPDDGRVVGCEIEERYVATARRYWSEAGVLARIDLRLAPALETLDGLVKNGEAGTFDFAFIDADKVRYDAYYERAMLLVRPGGIIAINNVLRQGRVADPSVRDESTQAMRMLSAKLLRDDRIYLSIVPIGDGMSLAMKR